MHDSLRALIELAATGKPISEDLSIEEQYPELVAPILRYVMLTRKKTTDTINGHLAGITKTDLIQAKAAYDKGYLMNLSIPYDGIQLLCQELVAKCRDFGIKPADIWQTFADGQFDWEEDVEYMSTL